MKLLSRVKPLCVLLFFCIPANAQQKYMDSLLLRLQEELSKLPGVKVERIEKVHGYVDLGLSVKWATCNVGADKPEDYGDYYAWGELEPSYEDGYNVSGYRFYRESYRQLTKYCYDAEQGYNGFTDNKRILDLEDDVAHVLWGDGWRMPTLDEFRELIDSCTWTWTTLNNVKGYAVRGNKPGYEERSIFLPATGGRDGTALFHVDSIGYYWSSSISPDNTNNSCDIMMGQDKLSVDISLRFDGFAVRPVFP
ncbi:MAG: hypothetical protein IK006_07195 [Bacteroidaceae bacterium]|nr:hypothetical protein [Bacteroidaceae bacterium]